MEEFKPNRFYTLVKVLPLKKEYPNYFVNIYHGGYRAAKQFRIGGIYHAISSNTLYDDCKHKQYLTEEEIKCFKEVDVGLSKETLSFIDSHWAKKDIFYEFSFFGDNVYIALDINVPNYHSYIISYASVRDINDMVYKMYKKIRHEYSISLINFNHIKPKIYYGV